MLKRLFRNLASTLKIGVALVALLLTLWSFAWVLSRPWRQTDLKPGQIQLRLVHWGDDREDAIVARLVAEFQARHPDIRVLRINPGNADSVTRKVQTMVASGDPPDVLQLSYDRVAGWAAKRVLEPLDAYLERDARSADPKSLRLDDFYGNVMDAFRFDGQATGLGPLYALAKDFTTVGFYYNKDLFAAAGLPEPPKDGWTWDEFIAAARTIAQLRDGRGRQCYGAEFVTWDAMLRVYCWTEGAAFTRDRFETYSFDDPHLQAVLDRLRGWFFDERHVLYSAKTQIETGQDPFLTGLVGMAGPYGRWKVPVYREITRFDWDFAPLPHGAGHEPANGIFTSAWAMAAGSEHKDAAWKLIRYLCGEDGQRMIAEMGLAIPTMKSVAESRAFTDPTIKPYNDDVYLNMVPYARPIIWPADLKYQHHLRIRMEEVFKSGQLTVAEALAQVEQEWREFRAADVMQADYPAMPWRRITGWILVPLAAAVLIGGCVWWRTRPGPLELREEVAGLAMVGPWLVGFVAFTAFPVVLSLLLSFARWSGLETLDHAEAVGWDNYKQLFYDSGFRKSLLVTSYYALLAVPVGQLLALLAAVTLNQEVRGIRLFRAAWYLPSVLAGVAIAILWRWVFHQEHGLLNALLTPVLAPLGFEPPNWFTTDAETWAVPAFVIMSFWAVGGPMMIYLAGLKGIPQELYEAASIDGAGALRRLRNVTLPMLSPVVFFNVIMAIIASFQIFTQAYVMTGGGPGDATRFYVLYLYNNAFDLHEMSYASAMAWLLLVIILGLTLLVMRGSRRFVYYEALRT